MIGRILLGIILGLMVLEHHHEPHAKVCLHRRPKCVSRNACPPVLD